MERLTKRYENGLISAGYPLRYYNYDDFKRVLGRLADIEDVLGAEYDLEDLRTMVEESRWVSADDQMPTEYESVFKKFKGTDKWADGMFESMSNDVIVSVKFDDGRKMTGTARTVDGQWKGIKKTGNAVAIHWKPFPKPFEDWRKWELI